MKPVVTKPMNLKRSALLGLGVYFGLGIILAQTGDSLEMPPLPSGPLLNTPANLSAWQMTYAYESDKSKDPSKPTPQPVFRAGEVSNAPPREVTLTYTKPLWHAAVLTLDGQKIEEWSDGSLQYFSVGGSPDAMQVSRNMSGVPVIPNYGGIGFPDMKWVSSATYAGMQSVGGRSCIVFKHDDMTAWIDLESRYPVQWKRAAETRTFNKLPDPTGMLELPPAIAKLSAANRQRMEILSRPIPAGG